MGQVLEFPSETVRTWLSVERVFRAHLSRGGIEPECQDWVMQQVRPVYDQYPGYWLSFRVRGEGAQFMANMEEQILKQYEDKLVGLLWEVVCLEMKLWRLGVRDRRVC